MMRTRTPLLITTGLLAALVLAGCALDARRRSERRSQRDRDRPSRT